MQYPGIPYDMNEKQRLLLANAMAHKKASKRCSITTINLLQCKQALRKAVGVSLFND
jgi:hypothetical protein